MKKEGDSTDSPHIIVTEVPPGFLKRRNVRSHFSRFGSIMRMSIQSSFCVITFENHQQARDAMLHGTYWKDMPLKIDFTPAHDPFGTDEAIINEELNWFAENTDFSDKPKAKSSRSKSQVKFSDVPPKKLSKVDLFDDDETSKSSEDGRTKGRWSDENKSKSSERRKTATSRFLQGIRTRFKSEEAKRERSIEESKIDSKPLEEDKLSSTGSDEFIAKSKLADESKPTPMVIEDFQFTPRSSDEYNVSSFSQERLGFKPKLLSEIKTSSRPFEEFKSNSRYADEDKLFEDYISKSKSAREVKTTSKLFEDFKFTSSFSNEDNKSNSKFLDEAKPKPSKFLDGGAAVNIPEIKPNLEMFDSGSQVEEKPRSKSSNENRISDENKPVLKYSEDSKTLLKTSDAPFQNRVATTLQDKLNILEERDRHIRLKLDKTSRFESSIQGTCPDMCPEKERVLRELMGIIAPYESLSDGRMDHLKAVKEYARSSADQEEPLPHDLRPEPVLTMTMTYLINCIIARIDEIGEENQSNWYDFCWGRLRAIRKDIIQQQLCDRSTVVILEQCARFHIACYDRLWGTSKSQFDDKINTETLVNCLQSLIHMYEDLHREGVSCPNEAEFNAYLILLKINSGFLMSEYQSYSIALKESKLVKEAVKIHLAYNNNMYSTFFKLAKQTSYLNACLMQRFFQQVRIQALNTTVKAHCVPNKSSNISVQFMMDVLKLDSSDDCISFCESMGLSFVEEEKSFKVSRNYFYITDNIYIIETPSSIVLNKRIPIAEAVVGDKPTLPIYLTHTVHDSFTEEGVLKENAIDASDQEEKMLRDDVQRKLLMSQLKQTFGHKLQKDESQDISQSALEDDLVEEGGESSFTEEGQEGAEVEYREKEDIIEDLNVMDSGTEPTITGNTLLEKSSYEESERPNSSIVFLNKPTPLVLHSPEIKTSKEFVSPIQSPFQVPRVQSKSPSPKASFSLENKSFPPTELFSSSRPILSTPKLNSPVKSEIIEPFGNSKPFLKSPEANPKSKKSFPSKKSSSIGKISPRKHDKQKLYMDKLRKKLSENMKRVSARKYLRIWKEKTLKLKSSNKLEAMMLYNMTVKEYIKLWGKLPVQHSHNLAKRLSTRKNTNLMVQMILHTDILDKVDKNVKKIGKAVINTLGETSVKQADKWGNIAQPNPVFWKVVFALPEPPEGGSTFSMKLRNWCKAVFYSRQDSQLFEAELHVSEVGVPVCTSVCVVEGLKQLEASANLTALVVVRARGWETIRDTENRVQKLLSLKNNPVPVAVLNVGQHIDLVNISNSTEITHLEQCLWNDSRTIKRVLCNLARNIYLYNLKVKPFCSVVEVFSEKLLDSIQQDSYFHDTLDEALVDPNNIIYFYNYLVDKMEEEIINCKVRNYFGTAYEFRENLKKFQSFLVFPDNYSDMNFERSLSHRCLRSKLRPMKTDFKDRKAAILFLKNYCDDLGCPNIVKKLVRLLKLPDEDENIDLQSHLRSVHWLSFIEIIIKEILTSNLLSFKVVFREDVIQNVIDSHFWFNTKVIENMR